MRSLVKLAAISAMGAAGAFLTVPAQAGTWMHNGSKMTLEENGQKRRITFTEPKAGLEKAGVKRGTVLFEGDTKKDGRISGYAKIFKAGCEPVDYFVEGTIDNRKGEIVLQGQAPVYSSNDCKIKGYSEDGAASTLVFSGQGGGTYAGRENFEQGDGGYASRDRQDPRNGQGNDNRGNTAQQQGTSQRDGYDDRQSGSGQYDDQQGDNQQSGANGQYDDRQPGANGQYDDRQPGASGQYDDRQSGASGQYDNRQSGTSGQRDDRQYDNRDPRSRDYADRAPPRNDYDPRNDRSASPQTNDQADDVAEDETPAYRYRYQRPYQPWWRQGVGR